MKRMLSILVSLGCAISFSYTPVSSSEEIKPIRHPNAQVGSGRPAMQALDDRSPIRSLSADLEVTKVCKPDEAVVIGQQATCFIIVRNLGPDPAFNVTVIDKLISTSTFIIEAVTACGASCTATTFTPLDQSGTVTCTVSSIAPNATVTITVPLSANAPQEINDVVTVSGQPFDPIPGNNSASGAVRVIGHSH